MYELEEPFNMRELLVALGSMKTRKACGGDGIPIEFFSFVESNQLLVRMLDVFNQCLESGVVESGLKDVIISFLHKKGSIVDCDNYRTLSLISHAGKALERMILNRLNKVAECHNWMPESQNGFRSQRGARDSLFVSRLVSSMAREKGILCYKTFVDLTKAYDKVDRNVLWEVLSRRGVPGKLVDLVKAIHVGSSARVRHEGVFSNSFELCRGLKQGSVFAPILFNVFFGAIIEAVHSRLETEYGMQLKYRIGSDIFSASSLRGKRLGSTKISVLELLFVDDAAFLADSEEEMQLIVRIVDVVVSAFGQEISRKKTEIMVVRPKGSVVPDPCVKIDTYSMF